MVRRMGIVISMLLVVGLAGVAGVVQPSGAQEVTGCAAAAAGGGYWVASANGSVVARGGAPSLGSMDGRPLNKPIIGIVGSPTGRGYWLVAEDGGVFAFGDAQYLGNALGSPSNVVGMASASSCPGPKGDTGAAAVTNSPTVLATDGSYVVPAGVTVLIIELWGGGGGGGSGDGSIGDGDAGGAGGGGQGADIKARLPVTAGEVIAVDVGDGGARASVASGGATGAAGQPTTIVRTGLLLRAKGGMGGLPNGTGGAGGVFNQFTDIADPAMGLLATNGDEGGRADMSSAGSGGHFRFAGGGGGGGGASNLGTNGQSGLVVLTPATLQPAAAL